MKAKVTAPVKVELNVQAGPGVGSTSSEGYAYGQCDGNGGVRAGVDGGIRGEGEGRIKGEGEGGVKGEGEGGIKGEGEGGLSFCIDPREL